MRDLEIRGAGNILGTEQSGHIASVGYELYCQLLENAVRQLKRLPPRTVIDVDVDLPGEAYLPRSYVPDLRLKIDLYRRLGRVTDTDGAGRLPPRASRSFRPAAAAGPALLRLAELRIAAHRWGIVAIHIEDRYAVSHYTDARLIRQLAAQNQGRLRVVSTIARLPAAGRRVPGTGGRFWRRSKRCWTRVSSIGASPHDSRPHTSPTRKRGKHNSLPPLALRARA